MFNFLEREYDVVLILFSMFCRFLRGLPCSDFLVIFCRLWVPPPSWLRSTQELLRYHTPFVTLRRTLTLLHSHTKTYTLYNHSIMLLLTISYYYTITLYQILTKATTHHFLTLDVREMANPSWKSFQKGKEGLFGQFGRLSPCPLLMPSHSSKFAILVNISCSTFLLMLLIWKYIWHFCIFWCK